MARRSAASPAKIRSAFASKTAFEALAVDSGEDTEEEQEAIEEASPSQIVEVAPVEER